MQRTGVEPAFAGNDQIGGGDALAEGDGVGDELKAAPKGGVKECEHGETKSASRAGAGGLGFGQLIAAEGELFHERVELLDLLEGGAFLGAENVGCAVRAEEWIGDVA